MQVRVAAFKALACWDLELLEQLEAQQPLQHLVEWLLWEDDASAQAACSLLVDKAFLFEHSRRRRCCFVIFLLVVMITPGHAV